ncbi:unnamed protein product, partial [Polarella glacialis]
ELIMDVPSLSYLLLLGSAALFWRASAGIAAAEQVLLTNLTATGSGGIEEHLAAPARWNAWQPQRCAVGSHWRCGCPQPPGATLAAISGPLLAAPGRSNAGLGEACSSDSLPAAPRFSGSVLLARRGTCSFSTKAQVALESGYCGLLVVNQK